MDNPNDNHSCWLGCQFWLGKENEQLLDDKESYPEVRIFVQLIILVHTKKKKKGKIAINNVLTSTAEIQGERT